jgi:hypothetical protein
MAESELWQAFGPTDLFAGDMITKNNAPLRSGTLKRQSKLHGERERLRICRKRRAQLSGKREPRLRERNEREQIKVDSRSVTV